MTSYLGLLLILLYCSALHNCSTETFKSTYPNMQCHRPWSKTSHILMGGKGQVIVVTWARGICGPRAYTSGKSWVQMLQVICNTPMHHSCMDECQAAQAPPWCSRPTYTHMLVMFDCGLTMFCKMKIYGIMMVSWRLRKTWPWYKIWKLDFLILSIKIFVNIHLGPFKVINCKRQSKM